MAKQSLFNLLLQETATGVTSFNDCFNDLLTRALEMFLTLISADYQQWQP